MRGAGTPKQPDSVSPIITNSWERPTNQSPARDFPAWIAFDSYVPFKRSYFWIEAVLAYERSIHVGEPPSIAPHRYT